MVTAPRTTIGVCLAVAAACLVVVGPAGATFPGRNGRIVFELTSQSGVGDEPCLTPSCRESRLAAVDPTTGKRLKFDPCTDKIECNDVTPAFSPDGSRITFGRYEYSTTPPPPAPTAPDRFQIAVTGLQGRSVRVLAEPAFDPAWSPSGRWIAFARPDGIRLIAADGSRTRTVLNWNVGSLDWSSKGRIAFVRELGRRHWSIYTVAPDGSDLERVTATGRSFDPSWSPDGGSLAYARAVGRQRRGLTPFDVVVIDATGRRRVVVRGAVGPVWSPNGKVLAFRRASGIWLLRLRDGAVRHLFKTTETTGVASMTWRPRQPARNPL